MDQLMEQVLDYLRGMWRRRFIGLAVAWLIAVAGVIVVVTIPNQYEASTRLFVDTQSVLKPLMAGLTVQPNLEQQIGILSRTLLSRPNLEKLVRMADLDVDVKTPAERDALIDRLARSIQLRGASGLPVNAPAAIAMSSHDNMYWLAYRDTDPARAKRTVEALVSIFVESGLGKKRRDTEKAQQFIDTQIQDYEQRLAAAERRLKDFKLRNMRAMGVGSDTISSMVLLNDQIAAARTEYRAAVEARDSLRKQLDGEEPVLLPDPRDIAGPAARSGPASELDGRIDALKRNIEELSRHFTDKHPDVISARRALVELEAQRNAEQEQRSKEMATAAPDAPRQNVNSNPVYQQLKVTLADAESDMAAKRGRLQDLEARYNVINATARLRPELEEELSQLNRDYQIQKSNYDGLVARREAAKLTSNLDESGVADFRIIDPPRVSPTPVAPNRLVLLALVVLVSLGSGLATSFAVSQALPTFSSTRALRDVTGRPVLGAVAVQAVPKQSVLRRQRRLAFIGAVGGLMVLYGGAFVLVNVLTGH